ncbi:O-methyltransferase-domain-containing protein [Xylariales sp. PMI_506]|nr:O-methyltransferase-domain-containing protein [Xylariales sp. PMI_506]
MESIKSQFATLAKDASPSTRAAMLEELRAMQRSIETPWYMMMELYGSHLKLAVIYIAMELGLFKALTAEGVETLCLEDLSEKSKASPALLERLLRYLSSEHYIDNVSLNQFKANDRTRALAGTVGDAGISHLFEYVSPIVQTFPSFLVENGYQDITSSTNTPFNKAFSTTLPAFAWLVQHPKHFRALQVVMTALQSSEWIVGFKLLDDEVQSVSAATAEASTRPFLVDVGGGHGHQCAQLLKVYPELHGKLYLQDLPAAVNKLTPIDGVTANAHDFFTKQPIEGAKFYYMRRILHDWSDEESVKILQHLAAAMSKDSYILVDEVVLPDVNAHWQAAMQDISMGILTAGKERTRRQWENLVKESGLTVREVHTYDLSMCTAITVLSL